ncbi:hypothetical protein GX48_04047 [Paracoccidioides brasiliensis]|nr:hypothetical protein GX48_04047 [Paracoccidioides brasiliensis]
MWNYSDSEPEDDSTMTRRCSYCGRFGSRDNIVEETGLCFKCHDTVHPSSKVKSTFLSGRNGSDGPSRVAAAVMAEIAAVEVDDGSSSLGSITSIHSDQDDDEDNENEDGDENESENENQKSNDQKPSGSRSNDFSHTEGESEICARCWQNPSTKILYNTPICHGCYQIAQEKRQNAKGTKRRFQPPTPHLQPGKRLTRVCDSCRQKRKRCQHRRVVDENDPEADFRRKRSQKERLSAPTRNREGRSTSSFSLIEVKDTVVVSETEQEPAVTPRTGTGTVTASGDTTTAAAAPHPATAVNNKGYSSTNLRRAIEESVHAVFSREMDRLVQMAESKLADAASALDDVKVHMTAWLEHARKGVYIFCMRWAG